MFRLNVIAVTRTNYKNTIGGTQGMNSRHSSTNQVGLLLESVEVRIILRQDVRNIKQLFRYFNRNFNRNKEKITNNITQV
jgi:hypothetical protein